MFHPAIASAMAHERRTTLVNAADRHRSLRAANKVRKDNGRRGR